MDIKRINAVTFVIRCAGGATGAYETASLLGLPEPLWAAMSALIVSQERLAETRSSFIGRILGTMLGIAVTVAVNEATSGTGTPIVAQMAVAVAICACVVHWIPSLRVAMWTCPIILLTAQPEAPIVVVALRRGSEVILGAFVGWAFHWIAEAIRGALENAEAASRQRQLSQQTRS
ncbi:MAG TPA: FUSC family protein [Acetobacteraceae bacterium]|nr:FUSC family protein [Acetobacteraceae bacterium]